MKRFTRIKVATDGVVTLEWTTHDDAETHTHALVCKDPPHPEFVTALNCLLPFVLDIIEVPVGYLDGMRVQALALSRNDKTGARGAVVSSLKTVAIANGPLVIHTPHLVGDPAPDPDTATDDRRGHMPDGMWDLVVEIEDEAWAYLDGKRSPKAQADLFDGGDDDDDDDDDPEPGDDPALLNVAPTRRRRPRPAPPMPVVPYGV